MRNKLTVYSTEQYCTFQGLFSWETIQFANEPRICAATAPSQKLRRNRLCSSPVGHIVESQSSALSASTVPLVYLPGFSSSFFNICHFKALQSTAEPVVRDQFIDKLRAFCTPPALTWLTGPTSLHRSLHSQSARAGTTESLPTTTSIYSSTRVPFDR